LLVAGVVVALAVVAVLTAPATSSSTALAGGPPVAFSAVRDVVATRCLACHSEKPSNPAFTAPPLGVMFDRAEQLHAFAPRIKERAVVSKTMPLANLTGMTDAERELLGRWVDQGARTE
jgi:uncharacterized membrane protein